MVFVGREFLSRNPVLLSNLSRATIYPTLVKVGGSNRGQRQVAGQIKQAELCCHKNKDSVSQPDLQSGYIHNKNAE